MAKLIDPRFPADHIRNRTDKEAAKQAAEVAVIDAENAEAEAKAKAEE